MEYVVSKGDVILYRKVAKPEYKYDSGVIKTEPDPKDYIYGTTIKIIQGDKYYPVLEDNAKQMNGEIWTQIQVEQEKIKDSYKRLKQLWEQLEDVTKFDPVVDESLLKEEENNVLVDTLKPSVDLSKVDRYMKQIKKNKPKQQNLIDELFE